MNALYQYWLNLPLVLQMVIKGLAVIGFMFPFGGACSLIERKVSAWMQGGTGPIEPYPSGSRGCRSLVPYCSAWGYFT